MKKRKKKKKKRRCDEWKWGKSKKWITKRQELYPYKTKHNWEWCGGAVNNQLSRARTLTGFNTLAVSFFYLHFVLPVFLSFYSIILSLYACCRCRSLVCFFFNILWCACDLMQYICKMGISAMFATCVWIRVAWLTQYCYRCSLLPIQRNNNNNKYTATQFRFLFYTFSVANVPILNGFLSLSLEKSITPHTENVCFFFQKNPDSVYILQFNW